MKITIIGGGIAGLSAGIYALQSGMDAEILEMHTIAGGNSTSWKRGGYLFEGGLHWLVGSNENNALNKTWHELGALQNNNPVLNRDTFFTYKNLDGSEVSIFRDVDKLHKHLLDVAPEDKKAIDSLIKDIKKMSKINAPVTDIKGVKVKYKQKMPFSVMMGFLGALPTMGKLQKITVKEYTDKFTNNAIKELLNSVVGNDQYSAMSLLFTLGGFVSDDAGYPKGGSLKMALNMANKFVELGGKIRYNTKVEKIVQNSKAPTIFTTDGEKINSDAVIFTADALTLNNFLEKPLAEQWLYDLEQNVTPLNCTFVSLGIKEDLSDLPKNYMMQLKTPFIHGGVEYNSLAFNNYASFENYAPKGCSAVTLAFMQDTYDHWKSCKENGTYESEKEAFANKVIDKLTEMLPQTKGKVEVFDVATPLTYERYCGTYRGSWMSVMTPTTKMTQNPLKSETIEGLYFAGQRMLLPGGLPSAVMTARGAVQHICKDKNIVFQNKI